LEKRGVRIGSLNVAAGFKVENYDYRGECSYQAGLSRRLADHAKIWRHVQPIPISECTASGHFGSGGVNRFTIADHRGRSEEARCRSGSRLGESCGFREATSAPARLAARERLQLAI
jgi:hypothetical protein